MHIQIISSLDPVRCLLSPDKTLFTTALHERLYNPDIPNYSSLTTAANTTGISSDGAVPFWLEGNLPTINITVGSPPQIVSVTLDTGSSLSYIPGQQELSTSEGNSFDPSKSNTWTTLAEPTKVTIDSRQCEVQMGIDHISLGNRKVLLPLGLNQHCTRKNGVLGLNKRSDYLQALANLSNLSIFSFAYNDFNTGGWFSIGTHAGLNPKEIIWTTQSPYRDSPNYRISLPYITHNNHRRTFKKGHTAIINTASPFGFLPPSMREIYYSTKRYPRFHCKRTLKETRLFNMTGIPRIKYPAMSLLLGPTEYLSEMVDHETVGNIADFFREECGTEVFPPMFLTRGLLRKRENDDSVIGANFLRRLKGVVFDFTPGEERVGFVPREWRGGRSGLLNPISSGASEGRFGVCVGVLAVVCCVGVMVVIW